MSGKYEVTDIAHPDYPWLHRIRALRDVGNDVHKGDLGGFVQGEDNLSQQGDCWLFGDAIVCEEALASQDARICESVVIRSSALVSGKVCINGNVVVEDHAIVMAGTISGDCFISGNACLAENRKTGAAPTVIGQAAVYGTVCGSVLVSGSSVILPGIRIDMPTLDVLEIKDGQTRIHRSKSSQQIAAPELPEKRMRDSSPEH